MLATNQGLAYEIIYFKDLPLGLKVKLFIFQDIKISQTLAIKLYGFSNKEELQYFQQALNTKGVGPVNAYKMTKNTFYLIVD